MISLHKKVAMAFAIMAAIASVAVADEQTHQQSQPPSTSSPRGMMGMMGMMENGSSEAMCGAMANHLEGRLASAKAELHVTAAQEPLWNAYAAAARDSARTMIALCTARMGMHDASVSLPDRLDQNERLLTAHLDAVRGMIKALKPLYADLDDDQKKTANHLFRGPMGMM